MGTDPVAYFCCAQVMRLETAEVGYKRVFGYWYRCETCGRTFFAPEPETEYAPHRSAAES